MDEKQASYVKAYVKGEPLPSERPNKHSEPPGFKTGLQHFATGAERMSKRVAALMAFCGAAGVVGSSAFAYWNARANEGRDTAEAKARADILAVVTSIDKKVDRIELTTSGLTPRIEKQELKSEIESNELAGIKAWARQRGMK